MIAYFHFPAPRRTPSRPLQRPSFAPLPDVLLSILRQLTGRQVRLFLSGGQEVAGKLVSTEPLVLVSDQGVARMVSLERVLSVAY